MTTITVTDIQVECNSNWIR